MPETLSYSRRRPRVLHLGVALLVLFFSAFALWSIVSGRYHEQATAPPVPKAHIFYGKVIDQNGRPLKGVEVKVRISELDRNNVMPGAPVTVQATQKSYSIWSAENGVFGVQLLEPYQQLQIDDLVLPGYEWVKDWGWTFNPAAQNTHYYFEGKHIVPAYKPDPENPAIFPMHELGNPAPATRPSRGGSDDGTRNEPTELLIPSAGPGAPRTHEEVQRRIGDYSRARDATAPRRKAAPLSPAEIGEIRPGMDEVQVRHIAGHPDNTSPGDSTGKSIWIYYVQVGDPRDYVIERYDVVFKHDGDKLVVLEVRGPIRSRS